MNGCRFCGIVNQAKSDYRVGVILDEPLGDNDGSVNGVRFFDSPAKHGVFAQCEQVTAGDFPPLDLFDADDSSSDSC